MPSITELQFAEAYFLARAIVEKNISVASGQNKLEQLGMNSGSAQGYLRTIVHILRGERFRRTINNSAAEFILKNISERENVDELRLALYAFGSHIDYYKTYGSHQGLRKIVASYEDKVSDLSTMQELDSRLDDEVARSRSDTRDERLRRLSNASSKPKVQWAVVRYFIRNPDVKAEVLVRAAGTCEACEKAAPFQRLADGQPYLEVHHKIPLAEGGEDTLDNSLALCPNCHREAHLGLNRDRFRR